MKNHVRTFYVLLERTFARPKDHRIRTLGPIIQLQERFVYVLNKISVIDLHVYN